MVLLIAAYCDCRYGKIPNWMIVGGIITGICYLIWNQSSQSYGYLIAFLVIIFIFYPFYYVGALGAGDVKLFAILGLFLSPMQVAYSLFYAFLIALVTFLFRKCNSQKKNLYTFFHVIQQFGILFALNFCFFIQHNDTKSSRVHLGLPLLLGVIIQFGGYYL